MILLGILVVTFVAYYYWKRRRLIWLASKLKGLSGYPFVGSALKFLDTDNIIDAIIDLQKRLSPLEKFWLGNRLFVFVNEPQHIERILSDPCCFEKGNSYDFLRDILGNGLVTLKGDAWRMHRKNINPCFSSGVINSYFPIINKEVRTFVQIINGHVDKGTVPIKEVLSALSLDMICETTLGFDMKTQLGENLDVLHAAHFMAEIIGKRFFQPWLQPKFLFYFAKCYKQYRESSRIIENTVKQIIKNKKSDFYRLKLNSNNSSNTQEEDEGLRTAHRNVFIQRLLQLSLDDKIFDDTEMFDELRTMLISGFETTNTTVYIILLMLAIYPEYQEKIYDEICQVFPDCNTEVVNNDLNKLIELNKFVKETQRLVPAVPFLTRYVNKEMIIDNSIIPAGTEFVMDIWGMHQTQKHWKFNAKQFNPENFAVENAISKHSYAFLPFGGGPHKCIGQRYAHIATRVLVVHAVKHFRFSTAVKFEDLKFKMSVTLQILNENVLKIERRSQHKVQT